MDRKINRIKTALVDKGKTNKWLAEQLGKDPATVSKWCTNVCQPSLETLMQIAKLVLENTRLVKVLVYQKRMTTTSSREELAAQIFGRTNRSIRRDHFWNSLAYANRPSNDYDC